MRFRLTSLILYYCGSQLRYQFNMNIPLSHSKLDSFGKTRPGIETPIFRSPGGRFTSRPRRRSLRIVAYMNFKTSEVSARLCDTYMDMSGYVRRTSSNIYSRSGCKPMVNNMSDDRRTMPYTSHIMILYSVWLQVLGTRILESLEL